MGGLGQGNNSNPYGGVGGPNQNQPINTPNQFGGNNPGQFGTPNAMGGPNQNQPVGGQGAQQQQNQQLFVNPNERSRFQD
jgi:hypothetical protein